MAINLEWANQEHSLIYITVVGRSEHEDFVAALETFRAMLESAAHSVDVICDWRRQNAFSPGMLKTARQVHTGLPPNLRFVVFLGRTLAWEIFLIFVRRVGKVPYRFMLAESLDDAHELLRRVRLDAALTPASAFGALELMKLFIASGIFHPEAGGPATYLRELLPEFVARGWDVRALSYSDHPHADLRYPYPVTRILRRTLPVRLLDYARAARPLLAWADVVYLHTLGLPLYGDRRAPRIVKIVGDIAWERAVRKSWIAPSEDIDEFQTKALPLRVTLDRARRAREARTMDGVIVPSEYLKRMVVGWGVDAAKVQVIYNALPPADHALDLSQAEARARLGLPDAPTVLTVGRLLPWKGVDHLIAALRRVPELRLIVAGDGDILNALKGQAADLGDRVVFLGNVSREQMPLYMKAADYVALYSGYEGLSHTLLESLRVGTPVIASDKGGNPEVVRHGVNGLLVPYVDVDALAAALEDAFRPGARAALAANSGVGMERFDFRRMVEVTAAALERYSTQKR